MTRKTIVGRTICHINPEWSNFGLGTCRQTSCTFKVKEVRDRGEKVELWANDGTVFPDFQSWITLTCDQYTRLLNSGKCIEVYTRNGYTGCKHTEVVRRRRSA